MHTSNKPNIYKCPNCERIAFRETALDYYIEWCCDNCNFFRYKQLECCNHPYIVNVFYTNSNGSIAIREQCFNCGKLLATPPKKRSKLNEENIHCFREELYNDRATKIKELMEYYGILFKGRWNKRYNEQYVEYLKSDAWWVIREKRLAIDNYLCHKCLTETATQVHHLTYERLGNELPEDLLSLCRTCHLEMLEIANNRVEVCLLRR